MADDDLRGAMLMCSRSRRAALRGSGALLAALGALPLHHSTAAQATPGAMASEGGLLVQSFSQGSLFPTQGDVGVLPYTAILWDAADRGFLLLDPASGTVGLVATESVLSALGGEDGQPSAVLLTLSADDAIWALRLASGDLGSDPGAVTYQGEPLPAEDAAAWLGTAPQPLPSGSQELGAGYLIIVGLAGLDGLVAGQTHLIM